MNRICGLAIVLALCAMNTAQALSIAVGTHLLQPNTSNQIISIYVQADGGEQVGELELYVQIGDGGPLLSGSDITPLVGIDALAPGTLFAPNGFVASETTVPPSYAEEFVVTNFGTVTLEPGGKSFVQPDA